MIKQKVHRTYEYRKGIEINGYSKTPLANRNFTLNWMGFDKNNPKTMSIIISNRDFFLLLPPRCLRCIVTAIEYGDFLRPLM